MSIRSNNPFASEAEAEFQSQINQEPNSQRISANNTGDPDPSILESNNAVATAASPTMESNGTTNDPGHNVNSTVENGTHEPSQNLNTNPQNGQSEPLCRTSTTNGTPPWAGVDDSVPDEPLPAYSEVDPNANANPQPQQRPPEIQLSPNNTTSGLYSRPSGPPPKAFQRPSQPPPHLTTSFQRPSQPPPPHSTPSFQRPSQPPPPNHHQHLSPETFSPRLPPRPISPRIPPRPNDLGRPPPRRNVFPGRTGATYSNTDAPPLPHRR